MVKRNLVALFVAVAMMKVAVATGIRIRQEHQMAALVRANLEALAVAEDDGAWTKGKCHSSGGIWNMASVCVDSGFEKVRCKVDGEVSIFGVKIKGSFKRGRKYSIPWCKYQCVPSVENCCAKHGIYTGETKIL